MDPRTTIEAFDRFLAEQAYPCELIVIGGAALALLGIIRRPTRDCDVLDPLLESRLIAMSQEFAQRQTAIGVPLDQDWLNNGPVSLAAVLPSGWRSRVVVGSRALRAFARPAGSPRQQAVGLVRPRHRHRRLRGPGSHRGRSGEPASVAP